MKSRMNWGILLLAGAFSLFFIGAATWPILFKSDTAPVGSVEPARAEVIATGEWQKAFQSIVPEQIGTSTPYRAPKELTTTSAVGKELFAGYIESRRDGQFTASEQQTLIEDLIQRNIRPIAAPVSYTLGALKTSATTPIDKYAGSLITTLRKSQEIQEYELITFSRSLGRKNHSGTPELKAAATNYKTIEQTIFRMSVPSSVAPEHLALLKGVSFLAESVRLMGEWNGDPILALAYVDAFNRAERAVQVATSNLFLKMGKVKQNV